MGERAETADHAFPAAGQGERTPVGAGGNPSPVYRQEQAGKDVAPVQPGPVVFGFAGWSGSGKTTLIEQLIPRFTRAGLTVSVIKHAHHRVDIDKPGKDSWRHREAGATEVLVTTDQRWALMHELRGAPEPTLEEHLAHMSPCDLVLVEGFKHAAMPKIEVHRPGVGKPLLYPDDPDIVAIATDEALTVPLPQLDIDDPDAVVAFILQQTGLKRACALCGTAQ